MVKTGEFYQYIAKSKSEMLRYKQKGHKSRSSVSISTLKQHRRLSNPAGTTFFDHDTSSIRVSTQSLADDCDRLLVDCAAAASIQFLVNIRAFDERFRRMEATFLTPFTTRLAEKLPDGWSYNFIMQTKAGTWRFKREINGKQISFIVNTLDEAIALRSQYLFLSIPADVTPSQTAPSPLLAFFIEISGMVKRRENVMDELIIFRERFSRWANPAKFSATERVAVKAKFARLTKRSEGDLYEYDFHQWQRHEEQREKSCSEAETADKLDASDAKYEKMEHAYQMKKTTVAK